MEEILSYVCLFLLTLFTWHKVKKPKDDIITQPEPVPEAPKLPVEPPTPVEVTPMPQPPKTNAQRLYDSAYASLGKRMGLDTRIPKDVNCANAATHVMILAGVKGLPAKGIPGTANLYEWLKKSKDFAEVRTPGVGDIVIYPTGYDAPDIPGKPSLSNGHVFIKGKWQLLSNNSFSGLWDNHWNSLEKADTYYTKQGGIPRYSFRWKG
jgi:hypothetical protein